MITFHGLRRAGFTAVFVVLAPTLAFSANQQDLAKKLTVLQALSIALTNSSILRIATSRLEQPSGRYAQSRAPLLPHLDVNVRQSYQTISLIGLGISIPTVKRASPTIVRGVTLKDAPWSALWPNLIALVAFAIVLFSIRAGRFRKQ